MDHALFREFEAGSLGFLHGISVQECGYTDTLLLSASYDETRFDDALFERLEIDCPPNIERAVLKRKSDYLAGRALVRCAQLAIGARPLQITSAANRAPVWPEDLTGSLSHARGQCACILSQDTSHSYGIDTEAIADGSALKAIVAGTLFAKDREMFKESVLPEATCATLVFSAKETLFKTLYPQVQAFFGFDAAELSAPPTDNTVALTLTKDLTGALSKGQTFHVRAARNTSHVLTWLRVPNP